MMIAAFLALAAVLDSSAAPAPARPDSTPRVVVRLKEFVVEGAALHDPLSSETVHRLPGRALRMLPVDRLADVLSLTAGVIAHGEELHVRGGRAGELVTQLQGITLDDPIRDRHPEIPLIAVREAELVSGGFDAEYGGALGGILVVRTVDPPERWGGELQWQTDGRLGTHYDRVAGRIGGPIASTGLGAVASVEVQLDDTALPALRTVSRQRVLGASFGWRADNRLGAHLKLATPNTRSRFVLEMLASRRLERPYDPAWTLDGWTTRCNDPGPEGLGCVGGPGYSPTPRGGFDRYRAADHRNLTDDRRLVSILSWLRATPRARMSVAMSWARGRTIASVDGRDDESQLAVERFPEFGIQDTTTSDPFHVYLGDEPFFHKSTSEVIALRASVERSTKRGDVARAGAGVTLDRVSLRQIDLTTYGRGVDSLRAYRTSAPVAFTFGQLRWITEGMVANVGMRAEYFSAGRDARSPSTGQPVPGIWSFSPRMGVAYPISLRDVFSLSYSRVQQFPARDYLYENRSSTTNRHPLGNPELEPATLVSYQGALKHLLFRGWWVQTAYFYRDVFGLVGARNTRPRRDIPLLRYQNTDDAHASGIELSLVSGENVSKQVELCYTYMHARGTYSREEGVPFGPTMRRRPESIGEHALDWDLRHSIALAASWQRAGWSVSWSTLAASGAPWTPRERRQDDADLSRENSRRLGWQESSAAALRWNPPGTNRRLTVGLDVRNVFDHRAEIAVTADGYPNPVINTLYDDYGAYRTETGLGGGAYYNDRDGDGVPGWVPVHDPRLFLAPRAIRFSVGTTW